MRQLPVILRQELQDSQELRKWLLLLALAVSSFLTVMKNQHTAAVSILHTLFYGALLCWMHVEGTASITREFQRNTLHLYLTQPVPRRLVWRMKFINQSLGILAALTFCIYLALSLIHI